MKRTGKRRKTIRKYQQKQILGLLQTLNEACTELKRFLSCRNQEAAKGLISDAYDFAGQIAGHIKNVAGEKARTVALLEEFRETLRPHELQNKNEKAHRDFIKLLDRLLIKIEKSVHDELKPDKLEIVFFSYKASMWDSIESIWFAAKEDLQCDAYVVPIPYFNKMQDGSFGKMHYEGGQYPDYVPVVDWETYDAEARQPDIIYTHYPYDDKAVNASIHPDFYSKRLREHCELLVHVPYFVETGYNVPEYYGYLPGVLYAHRVIVQSEAVRESYISHYKRFDKEFGWNGQFGRAEEKFIALGSPKFDKVIDTKHNICELLDKWQKLIEKPDGTRKKIILYNTHMFKWLNCGEMYFKKIQSVFDTFKGRDDVILWWRPHPNTELNFRTQRPQWLKEYKAIVNDYKHEAFGIYDGTPDPHMAITWSDAYYGDGSSLVAMYQVTGKPFLIQNAHLTKAAKERNELKMTLLDFISNDNIIWFVPSSMNGLFFMDMDTNEVEFAGEIPDSGTFENYLIASIAIDGDYLILVPGSGKNIVKYNIPKGTFESTPIQKQGNFNFIDSHSHDGNIYMIPFLYHALIKYNIERGTIGENKKLCAEIEKYITDKSNGYFRSGAYANDGSGCLMLASEANNIIVEYHLSSAKYELHRVGDEKNCYSCIVYDGSDYWVFAQKSIIKWNKKMGIVAKLDDYPEGFRFGNNVSFRAAVLFDNSIFAFPGESNMILKINIETNEMKVIANLDKRGKYSNLNFQGSKYLCAKTVGNYIYASSQYEDAFQKINPKTGEIQEIRFVLSDKDFSKVMDRPLFDTAANTTVYPSKRWENSVVTLNFFLERLVSECIQKKGFRLKMLMHYPRIWMGVVEEKYTNI